MPVVEIYSVNAVVAIAAYVFCIGLPLTVCIIPAGHQQLSPGWHQRVKKPWWMPPDWMVQIIWLVFYVLMGTASYLVWYQNATKNVNIVLPGFVYLINLAMIRAFGLIYYEHGWFSGATGAAGIVWLLTAGCIYVFNPISALAARMMIPHLLWMTMMFFSTAATAITNPSGPPLPNH